ncbi:MAG: radical SAM family heme chaperone HemW [Candidatus Poribacteria bacterium]|nr:radical SAM family heme chaperone HemW [Candidatus Poribacteria bacterium]
MAILPTLPNNLFGLYVHIPFCVHKCYYCDFATAPYIKERVPRFLDALKREAEQRISLPRAGEGKDGIERNVTSVFFGGGTPSLLTGDQLTDLLNFLRAHYPIAQDAEITVESNPETVDQPKLDAYRRAGVNRLSFGVQVFDDGLLKTLGRDHSVADVYRAYEAARAVGFDNVNLDLIFALPDQSLRGWQDTVKRALDANPEHLSVYGLTIEPKTVYSSWIDRDLLAVPDDDAQADMFEWTLDTLTDAGYDHYETSNYARRGRECRHNLTYWMNAPYVGLGPSAYGYLNGERYGNVRGTQSYIKRIEEGREVVVDRERLEGRAHRAETVMLALRMREGVDLTRYAARFGVNFAEDFRDEIDALIEWGLLERTATHIRLTRRGVLLSNEVFMKFIPADHAASEAR